MKIKTLLSLAISLLSLNASGQNLVKLTIEQKDEFVKLHNDWRADVGTSPLKWSDDIARYSGDWAMNLAKNCRMEHRPRSGKWKQIYGENIYWISTKSAAPKNATDSWGSEIKYYKKPTPIKASNKYGHYTQMVWKNTTEVGCAIAVCKSGGTIIVCNYNPAGNWLGEKAYD